MQIRTRLASVSLSHRSGSWACPPPCSGQPCVGMWEGRLGLLLSVSARNRVGGSGSALGGAGGPGVAWLCLLPVSPLRLEPEPGIPWRTSSFTMALETACHPLGKRPCEMQAFSQELYGLTDPLPLSSWALQGHLMRWVLPAPFHRRWLLGKLRMRNKDLGCQPEDLLPEE
ncbi:interleukin-1 receptor antagonist protein isoform X5 [Bubalus bubalis]|uniref:interleukin-1 receptor antagonist protein isoform X5 n=1 Tax=Bubalus bubalis TaxID=89462 RepID=UPI000DBC78AB|nr:interleukin-1 receptor antagonist protein isoform X5 [Bubalus bubalis]